MKPTTRRRFLGTTAAASASALAAPWIGWTTARGGPPSSNVRFANFGANGRAFGDLSGMLNVPNTTLVAVAEVDSNRLNKLREVAPDVKVYADWRELLDKEANHIDAAVVGTPDHMHAPIAMSAMQLGKHVYCEKPLTRTLHEARRLREFAAENHLTTQMGNQRSSCSSNKAAVVALQEGRIGKVREIHSRVPKGWGAMEPLPDRADPVPETLDWDLWIGVGKMRPFIVGEFHPSNWRKRIGYGTATIGDMGCHIFHPWFMGLGSPVPLSATSRGAGPVDAFNWPLHCRIEYRFQGNDLTDGDFDVTWRDGEQTLPDHVIAAVGGPDNVPKSGSVVLGTEGALVITHKADGGVHVYQDGALVEEDAYGDIESTDHHGNFADAIRGDISEPPVSHFGYSGPMTEAVLLGSVALRFPGETLAWDAPAGAFTNSDAANALIREDYREGWEIAAM